MNKPLLVLFSLSLLVVSTSYAYLAGFNEGQKSSYIQRQEECKKLLDKLGK